MIIRTLALAGGLAGGVAASQYSEFSQQYLQRLSGAVDELRVIAVNFDGAADLAGLSRAEALAELQGSEIADAMRQTMGDSLRRYDRLSADHAALTSGSTVARLLRPWRLRDTQLVQRTWEDFRPAVPVTVEGAGAASVGFGLGWLCVMGVWAGLSSPFRRRASV